VEFDWDENKAVRNEEKHGISGTFQYRDKVVDSLPGEISSIARCRHNLAPQAKRRSRRLSCNPAGIINYSSVVRLSARH
jgi:hypothetical protein